MNEYISFRNLTSYRFTFQNFELVVFMEEKMTVIEHLTELRKRLIIISAVFIISLALGFWLAPKVLMYLKEQPSSSMINWNVFSFTDGFMIYFKCAVLVSILFTLPVLLYQTWAFVKPGLCENESKGTLIYVPTSFLLFLIGVAFSYFVVFPAVITFMSGVNQSIGAHETYGIQQYFSFMFNVVFPISIVFEMPVVILFLTKIKLIDPLKLRKVRKYAYFLLVVVGVSITPPDFVSDLLIIFPLFLLFEISIICSSFALRRKAKSKGEKKYVAG